MGKVLVVEDDALLSKLYRTLIEKAGHQVVVAEDGDAGLAKARSEKPDLIMLDIMMPKMNGLQVLDALKKDQVTAGIPVMVLTGLSKVNEEKDVLARGATAYYDKGENDPKKVAEIVNGMLAKTVSGQRSVEQAAAGPTQPSQPNQASAEPAVAATSEGKPKV